MALRFAALLPLAGGAAAHGRMTLPKSRQGGTLGVGGTACGWHDDNTTAAGECAWYITNVKIPGPPTVCDPALVTAQMPCPCGASPDPAKDCSSCDPTNLQSCDWTWQMPWRAPGSTPLSYPCGLDSAAEGGKDGVDLPPTPLTPWRRGATVEVAMSVNANHGGGYAYRLCPATEKPTESCFQQHHLRFADNTTTVRFIKNGSADVSIAARRTSSGTTPAGSQWTKNPIPSTPSDQFPAPFPGAGNWAGGGWPFSLIDRVEVPASLAPGAYVLSWRWDCEITAQVWANCGDVEVTP